MTPCELQGETGEAIPVAMGFAEQNGADGPESEGPETMLEVSMLRAAGTVRVALIFLMLGVLSVAPAIISSRNVAYLALFVGTVLTIWTRFVARWQDLQVANQMTTAAGVVLFGDVLWTGLFVYGTGGLMSPFLALLFIPLIFGCTFFSVMELAAALVGALIVLIIVGFGLAAEQTAPNLFRMLGTVFATIAVTWIAYGLARVLERERRTNELVVRHMSEGVVLVDGGGVIRLVNPPLVKLTGIPMEKLTGLAARKLPLGRGGALLRQILGDVTGDGGPGHSIRDIQVEGERPLDLRVYTVRMGSSPRASGWLIISQDVTDLKTVARARETGVRFLSHEMRSPLSTLKIVSQIFGELTGQLTDSNADRMVAILDSETDRMLRMVGQFLDLAALDQGTFQLACVPIDVREVMLRVCSSLEVRAADKNLSVERAIPETLPLAHADPDRLEDVLHNLCDNALKYTPGGGHIRVSAAATDGLLELTISDNGQGISPDIQDDIFSEFVRAAEDGQSGRRMGVGLGLYMARRIIEEHGGEITVESALGEGSAFTVRLPVA